MIGDTEGGFRCSANPKNFVVGGTELKRDQLLDTLMSSKQKRVTLENNKKNMKIVVETVQKDKVYKKVFGESGTIQNIADTVQTNPAAETESPPESNRYCYLYKFRRKLFV